MIRHKGKLYISFFILTLLFSSLSFDYMIVFSDRINSFATENITNYQAISLPVSIIPLNNDLYPIIVQLKNTVLSNFLFYTRVNNGSIVGVNIKVVVNSNYENTVVKYINKTLDPTLNCTVLNFIVYLPSSMGSIYKQLVFYYQNISFLYAKYNSTYYVIKLEMIRPYIGDTLIKQYFKSRDFAPPISINYTFLVSKEDGKTYWVTNNRTIYCGYLPLLPPVVINTTRYWLKVLNNIDTLINTIKSNRELLEELIQKMENENTTQKFNTTSNFLKNIETELFSVRYGFFSTIITPEFLGSRLIVFQYPSVKMGIKELNVKCIAKKTIIS